MTGREMGIRYRPAWMPAPWLLLLLGVVLLGLAAAVRVSQTAAPDGWSTVEAVATDRATATDSVGVAGTAVVWQAGSEAMSGTCEACDLAIGERVEIAYDPADPGQFKPLEVGRMWMVGALGVLAAAVLLTALVVWSMPPAPSLPAPSPAPATRRVPASRFAMRSRPAT